MDPPGEHALRVAVEGCGHGTLHAIYAATKEACGALGWSGVDVLIIGGDFQAVRNASDLTVMSCPAKYREIGDFHEYYSGRRTAPYLTIFVGGNHEASSYLWELYYGGWVAPNIFYMGAANVVRIGSVRIAGMSGIWKGYNYKKSHYERLPYSQDDVKSIYHVRELDVRKLLQLRTQVDIGISHDWPRAIEKHGDGRSLFKMKPDFEQESKNGTLGNQAATLVMDRLRPPYWFAAHMHCKFAALRVYSDGGELTAETPHLSTAMAGLDAGNEIITHDPANGEQSEAPTRNADEIDLELDEDESPLPHLLHEGQKVADINNHTGDMMYHQSQVPAVPEALRTQLPAAFLKPATREMSSGQSCPPGIKNKQVKFLALDKCLPGRKFLQLLSVEPINPAILPVGSPATKHRLEYDPEWLAITRVFAESLRLGDRSSRLPPDLGEEHYRSLIEEQEIWVDEHVVKTDRLTIPENFTLTAAAHGPGMPEIVHQGPEEYNNPQTAAFCELLKMENKFFASDEEKAGRMSAGPPPSEPRRDGAGGGRQRGRGGHFGRGGGRGRGGGGGRGRGDSRGRGRGW